VDTRTGRTRRRWVVSAACAIVCLSGFAAGATAAPTPGKDQPHQSPLIPALTISAASVSATNGKLKGSATVYNGGGPTGRRVYVTLFVELTGADRLLKRTPVKALAHGASKTIGYSMSLPTTLPVGRHPIWSCADKSSAVPDPSPSDGCRKAGTVNVPVPRLSPSAPSHTEAPSMQQSLPFTTVPTAPIPYEAGMPQVVNDAGFGYYWLDVPASYDPSNQTPTKLFVWLHGCGGESSGDIWTVSPETVAGRGTPRDWISIAVGGTDDGCWDPNADQGLVTNAIADAETHFNIDRHQVILGGYSSGGDLAYRLAFYDSNQFAGLLAENTSPFRDTGSTEAASLAAASWKFHVVHLAHLQDATYPIAEVRQETDAMITAGFPLQRIEVNGTHEGEPGTDDDLINLLLPHIDDGWQSP
jgi:predicted esterase